MQDFHAPMFQANLLYGLNLDEDTYEELALNAWGLIGNKHYRLYKISAVIDKDTLSVELPCNASTVEAVTADGEDWDYTSNIHDHGDIYTKFTEEYIELMKHDKNSFYLSGHYVDFNQQGNTLYFPHNYGKVNILYKGYQVDENGLPELTDKEVIAIATYCAFYDKYKMALMTNNTVSMNFANNLKQEWYRQCDAARVPEHITQNEMDRILDAKVSWNRKVYNKSFKPIM